MVINNQPHILVVGGGSIGQRHIKNLVAPGMKVSLVEPDRGRHEQLKPLGLTAWWTSIDNALAVSQYTGAIIATPTHLHAEVALPLLQVGLKVLIEKPLAHTVAAARLLEPYQDLLRVGYTMRWHPAIETVKARLPQIGRVIHASASVGQYLPQWHPTEDYRQWYMAHHEQGGGAILDLSHELDYLQYLLGPVAFADAVVEHVDLTLEIDSDDLADIRGVLGEGVRFTCHMDLIDRVYHRGLRILGERGTIDWDHARNSVVVNWLDGSDWRTEDLSLNPNRNYQFMMEEDHFLRWCAGEGESDVLATYEHALGTLQLVESLRGKHRQYPAPMVRP